MTLQSGKIAGIEEQWGESVVQCARAEKARLERPRRNSAWIDLAYTNKHEQRKWAFLAAAPWRPRESVIPNSVLNTLVTTAAMPLVDSV